MLQPLRIHDYPNLEHAVRGRFPRPWLAVPAREDLAASLDPTLCNGLHTLLHFGVLPPDTAFSPHARLEVVGLHPPRGPDLHIGWCQTLRFGDLALPFALQEADLGVPALLIAGDWDAVANTLDTWGDLIGDLMLEWLAQAELLREALGVVEDDLVHAWDVRAWVQNTLLERYGSDIGLARKRAFEALERMRSDLRLLAQTLTAAPEAIDDPDLGGEDLLTAVQNGEMALSEVHRRLEWLGPFRRTRPRADPAQATLAPHGLHP